MPSAQMSSSRRASLSTENSMAIRSICSEIGALGVFRRPPDPLSCRIRHLRTDFSIQYVERFTRHPQIAQREQRDELGRVLLQPAVAHLHMSELALDVLAPTEN